jgi:hypothetical protein
MFKTTLTASIAFVASLSLASVNAHAQDHPVSQPGPLRDVWVKNATAGCEANLQTLPTQDWYKSLKPEHQDFVKSKMVGACRCAAEKMADEITSDELSYIINNKHPTAGWNALVENNFLMCMSKKGA